MTLTQEQAKEEALAAGRLCADLNGDGPGLEATCPCCTGRMLWRPDDPVWQCANECDPSKITTELHIRSTRTWSEATTAETLAIHDARDELEALWGLDKVGLKIVGARIVGRGSRASAAVYFDDGSEITFESVRDAARPSTLLPELAACVGALPGLKQQQALKGVTLLRRIAEHQVTFSEDEIARDWGVSYLQTAGGTIDHIIAPALGGTDAPDNFTGACTVCNTAKGCWPLLPFLLLLPWVSTTTNEMES